MILIDIVFVSSGYLMCIDETDYKKLINCKCPFCREKPPLKVIQSHYVTVSDETLNEKSGFLKIVSPSQAVTVFLCLF